MKKITVLDTSICTENMGDKIIMDSAKEEIINIFQDAFYVHIPTHDIISKPSYRHAMSSDYRLVCGTNLLSSNMNKYNQWKINIKDSFYINDVILLGVGWWQYQTKPNLYTKTLLKRVLSKDKMHSVRDSYTEKMLKSIGIENVINTSCPTMWKLTPEHCSEIPTQKAKKVVVTLTDYNKNEIIDSQMMQTIFNNYETVYFWIQAWDDYDYINKIVKHQKVEFVSPTLKALDSILSSDEEVDYIGTRLHAGIRALKHKRRSIIIGIDNRATEKAKDFNLTVLDREKIDQLEKLIQTPFETQIKIPVENIAKWKSQFITK